MEGICWSIRWRRWICNLSAPLLAEKEIVLQGMDFDLRLLRRTL